MKFELKMTQEDDFGDELVLSLNFDGVCLNEILPTLTQFLRGCGFSFNGELEIVDDSLNNSETEYE